MNDWVKDLKVGDKVIFNSRFIKQVGTVEKITPAGNIKVCGILFKLNGTERGGDMWDRAFLSKATPEKITDIIHNNIIAKAKKLMSETKEITLEQAKSIIVLLAPSNDKRSVE